MEWVETNYRRTYAPNTRETFRRFTLHQFVDAGLVVPNPDQPDRPVNSPKYCYQIEPEAHALLKTFGTGQWDTMLARYLERRPQLRVKYAQFREMRKIPLVLRDGVEIGLTPSRAICKSDDALAGTRSSTSTARGENIGSVRCGRGPKLRSQSSCKDGQPAMPSSSASSEDPIRGSGSIGSSSAVPPACRRSPHGGSHLTRSVTRAPATCSRPESI